MRVKIKTFGVDMEVKNTGVEFQVHNNKDEFLGDCYVTKSSLVWCNGKIKKENGIKIRWEEFIQWANSQS
jgi:hypothetical protein